MKEPVNYLHSPVELISDPKEEKEHALLVGQLATIHFFIKIDR